MLERRTELRFVDRNIEDDSGKGPICLGSGTPAGLDTIMYCFWLARAKVGVRGILGNCIFHALVLRGRESEVKSTAAHKHGGSTWGVW